MSHILHNDKFIISRYLFLKDVPFYIVEDIKSYRERLKFYIKLGNYSVINKTICKLCVKLLCNFELRVGECSITLNNSPLTNKVFQVLPAKKQLSILYKK